MHGVIVTGVALISTPGEGHLPGERLQLSQKRFIQEAKKGPASEEDFST